jgi:hypothetical protein
MTNDVNGAQMTRATTFTGLPYYTKVYTERPAHLYLGVLMPETHAGRLQSVGRFARSEQANLG